MLPNVIFHTTISKMKRSEFYLFAKMGNIFAAKSLIEQIVKKQTIVNIVDFAKHHEAIILPIYALEKSGANKIPFAYATHVASLAELPVDFINQNNKVYHTGQNALIRLLSKPTFQGPVFPKNYIILDDVITSGSTVMALKYYIEHQGGKVILVSSLATTFTPQTGHSSVLEIAENTYKLLYTKFEKNELNELLLQYEIIHENIAEISNSQAKYLATFANIDSLRNAFSKARIL